MNSHSQKFQGTVRCRQGGEGVALVVTLLMLSVITFLAIAFLSMSRSNRSAVSASLDAANARAMSDAALARAQAEIVAQMLARGDPLYYDYMVSRDFISPSNFYSGETGNYDQNNVNYDSFFINPENYNSADWAQNIANLYYDPRPPVFVLTNAAYPTNYDFRFWVDINRNGRFETNGYQPVINDNGSNTGSYESLNGEPEFIGVLRNPLYHPSSSNQFIGRYAYLVLPIGKTLDFNYIHNFLKSNFVNNVNSPTNSGSDLADGFARDQGIGSWELNLAGLLDAVSPWAYESNNSSYGPNAYASNGYNYWPPGTDKANFGNAFDDAQAILHYRYWPPSLMASLNQSLPVNYLDYIQTNWIDMYCSDAPTTAPFDYSGTNYPNQYPTHSWPGSYQTNMFYDVQDLFDPNKTSTYFTNRMILASQRTNTFDRYTFQRLLSCIGMGSSPENGVWVNDDFGNQTLRTKVNINYDNTAQITSANAPYAPLPTNLVSWTPLGFFTNAAELLLRSQTFMFTNYIISNGAIIGVAQAPLTNHFGITNIPIYRTNQPGIRYDASIHRMLQLAANIYDATVSSNYPSANANLPPVRHPSVFRPLFSTVNMGTTNVGLNITGYVPVTNAADAYIQLTNTFYDMPDVLNGSNQLSNANINIWGIPWVVAANKGLPQFYQYSYNNRVMFERKVQFVRHGTLAAPDTNHPPQYTNQFYCMSISNNFGMDAWNPYPYSFTGSTAAASPPVTTCYISNYITVQITNEYNYGFTTNITNTFDPTQYQFPSWSPWIVANGTNGFKVFISNNVIALQACYFSEYYKQLVFFTNGSAWSNQFLAVDSQQQGWPVHNWTLNVTNHVVYALFDGPPTSGGALLDIANLGPFGSSMSITNQIMNSGNNLGMNTPSTALYWAIGNANNSSTSPMSTGLQYQVMNQSIITDTKENSYINSLNGTNPCVSGLIFGPPVEPSNIVQQIETWAANDPIVHYTIDDLTWPQTDQIQPWLAINEGVAISNTVGKVNMLRYSPWGAKDTIGNNMLFKDPLMSNSVNWAFPTNKFPGVGWIGRVHRGTPWQTVYLKADNTQGDSHDSWVKWVSSPWFSPYEAAPETYPTNDWPLVDLFTTAPNDNAARGLLSVNQINDAAWAAVFAGVIAPTNATGGIQIMPNNNGALGTQQNFTNLMDGPNGINNQRTNYPNGIFHKVGDILGAPALTTSSPFLTAAAADCPDEIVERIPQQTLSLLKVGEPQFVIYAWGQSLKPAGLPYLGGGPNNNMYTNYEITGEVLTRTVCHLAHTNGVKMVIDSYNVEPGN